MFTSFFFIFKLFLCTLLGGLPRQGLAQSLFQTQLPPPAKTDSFSFETCFSPQEACDVRLIQWIQTAQQEIAMAIYAINLEQLAHVLILKSRQIPVRIVVDRNQAQQSNSVVPLLIKAGVLVRFGYQKGVMHHKFTVIDKKKLQLGSFNYTHHASYSNQENQLYLGDPPLVQRYLQRFEELWSRGSRPAHITPPKKFLRPPAKKNFPFSMF